MAVTYDKDTDYQALIDQAVAAGDFKAAGAYEQQRNAKIAGEGITAYQPTYNFGSVYDQQHFTNEELGEAYRYRQAAQDGATDQDSAHRYVEQTRGGYGYSGGADGSQFIPVYTAKTPPAFSYGSAPEYVSQYQDLIDRLRDKILDRDPFSYDPEKDPAYQQYRDSYTRGGQRAMQDTLGQISARTGGLASSYAGSAAQQTYDSYMAALADKVPELRQLAYSMYQDEGERQRLNLNMIAALEQQDYGRYQDLLSQYNADRNLAYSQWRDQVGDLQDQTRWNYQIDRDKTQWDYQVDRDKAEDQRYQDETDYQQKLLKAKTLAAAGDFSGYLELGYSDEEIQKMKAAFLAEKGLGGYGYLFDETGEDGLGGLPYGDIHGWAGPGWVAGSGDYGGGSYGGSYGGGGSYSDGRTGGRGGYGGAPDTGAYGSAGAAGEYNIWSGVEDWVAKYGTASAKNYIKEHYKELGYKNQSTALAGWENHLLELGRASGAGKLGSGTGSSGSKSGSGSGSAGAGSSGKKEITSYSQCGKTAKGILNHTNLQPGYVVEQTKKGLESGDVSTEEAKFLLKSAGFKGFSQVNDLGIGPVTDFRVLDLVKEGKVEMYTDQNGRLGVRWRTGFNGGNYTGPSGWSAWTGMP